MKTDDKIAESLGVPPISVDVDQEVLLPVTKHDDFEYARGHLISAIEKGQEALTGILDIADRTQTPRSYEVVATLIKAISDSNKDLLELSKRKKDLEKQDSGPTTVNNNLFVGSTAELLKLLKDKSNEQ